MIRLLKNLRAGEWLTLDRVKLWARIAALTWVVLFAVKVLSQLPLGIVYATTDFVLFWAPPRLALQGHAASAYSIHDLTAFARGCLGADTPALFYVYPPVAMLLTVPFALPPFVLAYIAWLASGLALLTRILKTRMGWKWASVAVLATPAFFLNAHEGQNGAFSAACFAGAVMLLDSSPVLAGLLFGLMCWKPQLCLLIPVALIAGGRWRTTFAAAATVTALMSVSILFFGWTPWEAVLRDGPFERHIVETLWSFWRRQPTIFAAAKMLSLPNTVAYTVQVISAILAAVAVFIIWRSPASTKIKGAALFVGAFLATPYAGDFDMVVLLFAAVWIWDDASQTCWRPWEQFVLAGMLAWPAVMSLVATFTHLQIQPLFLWSMLILLVARAAGPVSFAGGRPPRRHEAQDLQREDAFALHDAKLDRIVGPGHAA